MSTDPVRSRSGRCNMARNCRLDAQHRARRIRSDVSSGCLWRYSDIRSSPRTDMSHTTASSEKGRNSGSARPQVDATNYDETCVPPIVIAVQGLPAANWPPAMRRKPLEGAPRFSETKPTPRCSFPKLASSIRYRSATAIPRRLSSEVSSRHSRAGMQGRRKENILPGDLAIRFFALENAQPRYMKTRARADRQT